MTTRTLLIGAVSALSLMAGSAIAQDQPGHKMPAPGSKSETMSAVKDSTAGMVGKASAEMTTTAKGFVAAAAMSDMYEIEAAKIAQKRASDGMLKSFADRMIKDHTDSTAKLTAIVAKDKLNIAPPASLDNRHQGLIDDLRGAKAADFDHRYIAQQVAAHEEAEILLKGYYKDGDNADIKQFAGMILPIVQAHLRMVKDMQMHEKK